MLKRTCIAGMSKGIFKRRFYHLFLIAFAFIALLGLSNAPVVEGQDSPKAYSQLLDKAQAVGSVRIIVRLDRSSRPEGLLSGPQEVIGQRARISRLQDQLHKVVARYNVRGSKRFKYIPYNAMEVDSTTLGALIANPLVVSIEEDVPVSPSLTQSVPLIKADQAWTSGYTGAGWTVAILDTGVDKTHSMLAGKVVAEACFSTNSGSTATTLCPNGKDSQIGSGAGINCNITGCDHGTHVAGIAAGNDRINNIYGVAKDANIIAIQVYSNISNSAASYSSDQILALEHVYSLRNTYKIAAVNMSLGGGQYFSSCNSDSRREIIDNLRAVGIATVISSGNDHYTDGISAPACISTAVSVGATDKNDIIASYSNSHPTMLSLFAPGSSIYSAIPGGWATFNGTSMAAPHVTGAWAILKQKSPAASVADILYNIQTTGTTVTTNAGGLFGGIAKRIDVLAALNIAGSLEAPTSLSISVSSANTITLNWTNTSSSNKTGFKIERKTEASEYSQIATVSANTTEYSDSGLTADTIYYYRVKAYCADSDSVYSNETSATLSEANDTTPAAAAPAAAGGGGGGGGCFIATAAFGSLLEPHVQILRDFRDRVLLNYSAGKAFVRFYYRNSPPIADKIATSEGLRLITRVMLMPVIAVAYLIMHLGMLMTILLFSIFVLTVVFTIRTLRTKMRKSAREEAAA